jgi:hypothetical protein
MLQKKKKDFAGVDLSTSQWVRPAEEMVSDCQLSIRRGNEGIPRSELDPQSLILQNVELIRSLISPVHHTTLINHFSLNKDLNGCQSVCRSNDPNQSYSSVIATERTQIEWWSIKMTYYSKCQKALTLITCIISCLLL